MEIRGKEIEVRPVTSNEWVTALTPVWNWTSFDYRIKPESTPRPYTFKELQAEMAKGKVAVKLKEENTIFTITQVSDDYGESIKLTDWKWCSLENLLKKYQWLDGSPCGVIEEE